MFSFKSIVLIAAAFFIGVECSEVAVAAVAAPLTVPAHVGYAHSIPQNIAPYASQVSVVNRGIAAPLAAPIATPFAAPVAAPLAAPYAAPFAAPFAAPVAARFASPYYAAASVFPAAAPYALPAPAAYAAPASYAAPYPFGAPLAGPVFRNPFGVAPAFVR